jgi:hypothetical protein
VIIIPLPYKEPPKPRCPHCKKVLPEDDFSGSPVSAILGLSAAFGVLAAGFGLILAATFGVLDGFERRDSCAYNSVIRVVGFTYTPACYLGRILATPIGGRDE